MNELFLRVLSMSLSATLLAAAVLLVRPVLKGIKAPKWLICALWGVLALRLLVPFSFESRLSVVPEPVASGSVVTHYAHEHWNRVEAPAVKPEQVSTPVQPEQAGTRPEEHPEQATPVSTTQILAGSWLIGVGILLAYGLWSYWKIRRQVAACVKEDGLWLCDHLQSPFILGFLRPRIYLPSDLSGAAKAAVVAHEKAHLARRDHWWKPLGFLLLALHWFNPVMWLCYALLCRDIESACDEKVIRDLSLQEKKAYSSALLSLSLPRRQLAACPLAFGEVGVKERVKNVLNYKKPAFWVVLAAVAAGVILAVCFLSKPPQEGPEGKVPLKEASRSYDEALQDGCMIVRDGTARANEDFIEWFAVDTRKGKPAFLRIVNQYSRGLSSVYDPQNDGKDSFFVTDLTYQDGVYTTECYENGPDQELVTRTYPYLIVDRGEQHGKICVSYLLSNDPNMTFARIQAAQVSAVAQSDPDALESKVLYWKYEDSEKQEITVPVPEQLSILADHVSEWTLEGKDPWDFVVTDLNDDGGLELITTVSRNDGSYSETQLWSVNENGDGLKKWDGWNRETYFTLEAANLRKGSEMTLPASLDPIEGKLWVLTTSRVQDSPDHWRECQVPFCFYADGSVGHYKLASMDVRVAENGAQTVICSKNKGVRITEEEYQNQFQEVYGWAVPLQVQMWWQTGTRAGAGERDDLYTALMESWERFCITGRDTVYTYEGEGFGGDFTITLKENGTFEYYEGGLSSFIGSGTWSQEEDVIILQERTRKNRFRITQEGLEFLEEGSGNFGYVKLEDGARFLGKGPLQQGETPTKAGG